MSKRRPGAELGAQINEVREGGQTARSKLRPPQSGGRALRRKIVVTGSTGEPPGMVEPKAREEPS
jgi:hypothetical protein